MKLSKEKLVLSRDFSQIYKVGYDLIGCTDWDFSNGITDADR